MKDIQMIFKQKESKKETYFIREFGFLQFILLRGLFVCLSVCGGFFKYPQQHFSQPPPHADPTPTPNYYYLSPTA